MEELQNTIDELQGLLNNMPGVSVTATEVRADNISIEISIEEIESIGPIVYAANGANIPIDIWSNAPPEPRSERSNPKYICYRISVTSKKPNSALESIQIFGIFLIWYLHAVGSIIESEANRLLSNWNGQLVGT